MTRTLGLWPVLLLLSCVAVAGCGSEDDPEPVGPTEGTEGEVADVVRAFFERFNDHSFADADEFTEADWQFVSPAGVWHQGRKEAVERIGEAHETFLAGVGLRLDDMSITFATDDVAVVTTTNTEFVMNSQGPRRQLRSTFVVRESDGQWSLALTQHAFIGEPAPAINGSSEDQPREAGGEPMSEEDRAEAVRTAVAWYRDVSATDDLEDAAEYAAEDFNSIGPTGFWDRGREAVLEGVRDATFLEGVAFTPDESYLRFLSDDVALVVESTKLGPFTLNGVAQEDVELVISYLVVNHGGAWLLEHNHSTAIEQ
jgi:ketosteroid isomerase-like protein